MMQSTPLVNERGRQMQEDRIQILKMLEEGKITAEEAARLLDALEEANEVKEKPQTGKRKACESDVVAGPIHGSGHSALPGCPQRRSAVAPVTCGRPRRSCWRSRKGSRWARPLGFPCTRRLVCGCYRRC